jgi:superfamily II DNA or RNA helicase
MRKTKKTKIVQSSITIPRPISPEIIIDNSPVFHERCQRYEKPCTEIKKIDDEIRILGEKKREIQECCNHEVYWSLRNQPKTLLDLLQRIFSNNISSCDSLFAKFPESSERTSILLSRAYIFEALWKIIFLLNLDNIAPGFKRNFKVSIEKNRNISIFEYLNRPINEGNRAGVCDLYFTVEKPEGVFKEKINNACEDGFTPMVGDAYLFTSKYYKKEKGLGKYDYEKIITEAIDKYPPSHKINSEVKTDTFRIITLINNKDEFIRSLRRNTDRAVKKYVLDETDIYGYDDLSMVYYKKLYQWLKLNFTSVSQIEDEKKWLEVLQLRIEPNIVDILRFHQQYFVDYTCDLLKEKTSGKVIWGAVARSGKSYMIGGLVAKRRPDVVLLLLGAVGETKEQFIDDLFKKYSDLKGYIVIDTQDSSKKITYTTDPVVIVISQEKMRGDISKMTDFIKSLDPFLKNKNKIIFFDEIHQGGSESSMQRETLEHFYKPEFPEPILIMVTATYTKPMIKYSDGLGSGSAHLVTWSYDMIMKMKSFSKTMVTIDDNQDEIKLINISDPDYVRKMTILYNIAELYNHSGKSDETISYEYDKYPELKYLIPTIETPRTTIGEGDGKIVLSNNENIKKLWEINGDKLKYESSMMDYLDYIYKMVYGDLLDKQFNFVANGTGSQIHSQLWFLPTQLRKGDSNNPSNNKDDSTFEIVSRRLAECIISNKFYKKFNVCIVHSIGTKNISPIMDADGNSRVFFECITAKSVKECIRDREVEAKAANRSLIILTGKRLRLGISLPCVDVAIHMDPLQSYDIIYQSMFRVLTERRGKTRGFFVDMLADRAIRFVYNYTIQSKTEGLHEDRPTREDIRNSLLLFDVNGIKEKVLYKDDTKNISSYDNIAKAFGIDSKTPEKFDIILNEQYMSVNAKGFVSLIKGLLTDKKIGNELKKIILKLPVFGEKQKRGKQNKKVKDVQSAMAEYVDELDTTNDNSQEDIVKPQIDEKVSLELKIRAIYQIIENSFTLFIWFTEGEKTIQELLIEDITLDYDKIRECKEDHVIYHCYLALNSNSINITNLSQTELEDIKLHVDEQLNLMRSIYRLDSLEIRESINNIYNNIKSVMNGLGGKMKEEKEKFRITDSGFCPKDFIDNEKVLEIIRKHLTPKEEEKNLFGEVFTPLELVCEMLSKLPSKVWIDKDLKWFDPANGIGNFPIVVYYKLMVTLKGIIGNPKKRSKHIIEQMLYMNELNPVNVSVCRRIFKMIDPDATPNIFKSDFLEKMEFGGVSKFDIIIGNPPFQNQSSSETAQGGHDLYPSFFIESFKILKENGYLSFINPAKWRAPDKKGNLKIMWDIFTHNNAIFLKIYGFEETRQIFNGGAVTRIDYYILQKNTRYTHTIVIDEQNKEHEIDMTKYNFLPNYNLNNIKKLLTNEENGNKVIYSSSQFDKRKPYMNETKTSTFKYPIRHSHTIIGGDILYWSSTKTPPVKDMVQMFGIPKVILVKGLYTYPYNDYKGEYGMSNYSFGIPIKSKKEGDCIVEAINTDNFSDIIKATKWSSGFTDHNMFKYFRPDFYKDFLGKTSSCSAIKIQAAVRGHQTRKKYKKGGISKKSRRNIQ